MKTKSTLTGILLLVLVATNTFAQIPNGGFESWATFGGYMEANGWSSTNSVSTGSFYPITQAADPYPTSVGNFSIRIENKPTLLPNYDAIGFVWNNLITDPGPSPAFPIIGHPTSLTGYYKWVPQNGDTMNIGVILYQGGVGVANGTMTTTIASPSWASFNIPISIYTTADSATILIGAYNSNGPPPQYVPYGNSVLNIDNLNFDMLITGISKLDENNAISFYPNPASEKLIVTLPDYIGKQIDLKIYNAFGQQVLTQKIPNNTATFDVSDFAEGIYFVHATTEDKIVYEKKIIIAK